MNRPRFSRRIALPNATVKTVYMTNDGLATAVSQAFTCNQAAPSPTNVEKAAGTNFAATAAGCMLRCVTATIAANVGVSREVTVRNGNNQLSTNPFPANMTAGDTFVLERVLQTYRRATISVEAGGHAHVSFNKGAALVGDTKIDDTMIRHFDIPEEFSQIDLLTVSDVSAFYANIEAE